MTATFGVSGNVYQVNGLCGPGREDSTLHSVSCCISLIQSLQTFTFVYYPGICLGRLKKPYLTSVMIACLWFEILSWDLVIKYNGPRRLEGRSNVISCCTWKLTGKKKKIFTFWTLSFWTFMFFLQ